MTLGHSPQGLGPQGKLTMILLHSWKSLQTTFPTRGLEWMFGLAMLNMGLIFWITPGLFDTNIGWNGLARIADQGTWCVTCLLVGLARLAALTVNGMWWRSPLVRCLAAFISCFIWWQLGVGLVQNKGIGLAILPLFFMFEAYNAVRCGRKVGVSEYVHRLELAAEAKHGYIGRIPDA